MDRFVLVVSIDFEKAKPSETLINHWIFNHLSTKSSSRLDETADKKLDIIISKHDIVDVKTFVGQLKTDTR